MICGEVMDSLVKRQYRLAYSLIRELAVEPEINEYLLKMDTLLNRLPRQVVENAFDSYKHRFRIDPLIVARDDRKFRAWTKAGNNPMNFIPF